MQYRRAILGSGTKKWPQSRKGPNKLWCPFLVKFHYYIKKKPSLEPPAMNITAGILHINSLVFFLGNG